MTAPLSSSVIPGRDPGISAAAREPWLQTATGRAFALWLPTESDVTARDIAEGLAKACRFAGQIPVFYSVAQHSILVAEMLPPEARPYGLLHDGHEAYVGDLATPVKRALGLHGGAGAWEAMVERLDAAIHAAAGLPWPPAPEIAGLVKLADLRALATERRDVVGPGPDWDLALPAPADRIITPWPWHRALDAFADRCRRWLPAFA